MTISEVQSILHCPDAYGGIYGEKYGQAMAVAFKSLEAWKRVKAEINSEIKNLNESALVSDNKDVEVLELEWVLDIIDKHLKEEEE